MLNALKISKQDAEKQKSEYEKILGNMKSEFDSYQKMSEKLYSNLVEHTKHQEEAYDFKLKDLSTQFKQETDELKNFKKDKFLMSGGDNLTEVKQEFQSKFKTIETQVTEQVRRLVSEEVKKMEKIVKQTQVSVGESLKVQDKK